MSPGVDVTDLMRLVKDLERINANITQLKEDSTIIFSKIVELCTHPTYVVHSVSRGDEFGRVVGTTEHRFCSICKKILGQSTLDAGYGDV